jgi:hypothetical protein
VETYPDADSVKAAQSAPEGEGDAENIAPETASDESLSTA